LNRKDIRYSRKAENIMIKEKLETASFRGERERGPGASSSLSPDRDFLERSYNARFFGFFALEEVADRLSRNVGKELPLVAA
jgi:hypothetical protein